MLRILARALPVALITLTLSANAQTDGVQQHLAALKQTMAENHAKLAKYQWLQTTDIAVKGETKKEKMQQCRIGADGKQACTPVDGDQPQQQPKKMRGLKGKIVAKKIEEMKEYTERLKGLISHYAPPDPAKLKADNQAGNASFTAQQGTATLTFNNYYKPGDKVSFVFNTVEKKLLSYNVATFLDDPKEPVTLDNNFAELPDGTSYLAVTELYAKDKDIRVKTTNSGHSLIQQ